MATAAEPRATLDDLYRVEGKAELIGGRIVHFVAAGDLPGTIAGEIFVCLHAHARRVGHAVAHADGVGFAVPELPSGRESFSPDASYYTGPRPAKRMRFLEHAPTFAVEVRSEGDYTRGAERAMAAKRVDYFAAGTLVVWDVDTVAELIHVYRSTCPETPTTYARGQVADAEPAVPGWTIDIDAIFGERV
jgi:Uma2 family endonuclease